MKTIAQYCADFLMSLGLDPFDRTDRGVLTVLQDAFFIGFSKALIVLKEISTESAGDIEASNRRLSKITDELRRYLDERAFSENTKDGPG